MPSARPSATATIITSSMIEPPADFSAFLATCQEAASSEASSAGTSASAVSLGSARRLRRLGGRVLGSRVLRAAGLDDLLGRLAGLVDRTVAQGRLGLELCDRVVQQPGLDALLRPGVAALADAGALADPLAQVVELRAAHVAAGGDLDALDLRRVHGERALHADAERLLADRERLARAVALALDDHALEDLGAPARALDHLEVDLHPVAGLEGRDAAQLGALEAVDDGAHGKEKARGDRRRARAAQDSEERFSLTRARGCACAARCGSPRGGRRAGHRAPSSRGTRPAACSAGTPAGRRARR